MTRNIVVLGGGTGGTIAANRLRRVLDDDVVITVVDKDDERQELVAELGVCVEQGVVGQAACRCTRSWCTRSSCSYHDDGTAGPSSR